MRFGPRKDLDNNLDTTAPTGSAGAGFAATSKSRKLRPPHRRRSIAMRTTAGVVALVFVVLAALVVGTYAVSTRTVNAQLDESVRGAWERASTLVTAPSPGRTPDLGTTASANDFDPSLWEDASGLNSPSMNPLASPGLPAGTVLVVLAEDGTEILAGSVESVATESSLTAEDVRLLANQVAAGSKGSVIRTHLSTGSFAVLAAEIPTPPSFASQDRGRTLILGLPSEDYDQTNSNLLLILMVASVVALALVGLGVWWWIRRSMNPLERVASAAVQVSIVPMDSGSVSLTGYALPEDLAGQQDEVGDVALALNQLIGSVDRALESRAQSEERLREFLADASHELRTPLAAVRGYSDMIRLTEPLSQNASNMLERVLDQSTKMSDLVERLLVLARLDAQAKLSDDALIAQKAEEHRDLDLGELVVESATDAEVTNKDHRWVTVVPDDPVIVNGSRTQLVQVISNLLSNAQKHTPAGTRIETVLKVEDDKWAVLSVSDNGPGIPPDLQTKVFERFVRADSARSTRQGSTGLGLSIVRSVVRAHGGEAVLRSKPGQTTFEVKLPVV